MLQLTKLTMPTIIGHMPHENSGTVQAAARTPAEQELALTLQACTLTVWQGNTDRSSPQFFQVTVMWPQPGSKLLAA